MVKEGCQYVPLNFLSIYNQNILLVKITDFMVPLQGFGQNCTPRGQCTFGARLQDDEIKLLAEFVRSQADQGWTSNESYGD